MKTDSQMSIRASVEFNLELLDQAVEVLSSINDTVYIRAADLFDGQRIGAHMRHILEFYERLLDGVRTGRVDYAARRRDRGVEFNRTAAVLRMAAVREQIRKDEQLLACDDVRVQSEDSDRGSFLSSVGRELDVVASHTVHHFALIAVLLRYFGLPVPRDFGISKATLRYRAQQEYRAA